MGKWSRTTADDIRRRLIIAWHHPRYEGRRPVEALRDLRDDRREQRRQKHRDQLSTDFRSDE